MYDYSARMYMPDIGRWGVVDPLTEATPNFSPYAYALNNPIRYVDPTGMIAEDCPYCPKPERAGESRYGSDGKYYSAATTSANSTDLEWLNSGSIEEVLINPSSEAQAKYNRRQAESRLHGAIEEYFKSSAVSVTVGGEVHGVLLTGNLSLTLSFNLGTGQPQLFGSGSGKLGLDYAAPGVRLGGQLAAHDAYGIGPNGERYTDVFEGMENESTGYSGSLFLGGGTESSSLNGVKSSFGTKTTFINLGTGWNAGKTSTNTTNISKWLKRNFGYSYDPQFN